LVLSPRLEIRIDGLWCQEMCCDARARAEDLQ
jgi:hypothetical protein